MLPKPSRSILNVTANYDGQTVTIGQIAVATEANTAGLIASGNNNVSGFKMMLSNIARTSFDIA
jgi:flagellar hook protein FlgE